MNDSSSLAVSIRNACVDYGTLRAVDDVSIDVAVDGVHVLLGRSGSGKTTLLRAIAGFEPLTSGEMTIADRTVDDGSLPSWIPPEERRIGFVFQDYALFTHLDARGNVAFGAPGPRELRHQSASQWLDRVHLGDFGARKPGELSGGEQQRVALARALAQQPKLVLLDEPFSNLDPHLRRAVRRDTVQLIRDNNATAIFVTHDVEEAFSIGDMLTVLEHGRVVQTGTPAQLYNQPATREVARLCGEAAFLPVDDLTDDGRAVCALGAVEVVGTVERGATLVIRPEQLVVSDGVQIEVVRRRFLGPCVELELALGEHRLIARPAPGIVTSDRVDVSVRGAVACI